jgi:diguanylate cyclase (GGDEF)-like protein
VFGCGIPNHANDSEVVGNHPTAGFRINDRHGHAGGDRVLMEVASVLRASVRRTDTAARIGGDEFAVVLVGGDGAEASLVGERLRARVEQRMTANQWAVTVSIGAVSFLTPPKSEEAALAVADDLLYHAKASGKNKVLSSDFPTAGSLGTPRRITATPAVMTP